MTDSSDTTQQSDEEPTIVAETDANDGLVLKNRSKPDTQWIRSGLVVDLDDLI